MLTSRTLACWILLESILTQILTGLVVCSAPLLGQSAQSLQQSGVLGLELFNQTLSGALVHHSPVLDTLCPEEVRGCRGTVGYS